MYHRTSSDGFREIDRWDDGVGWIAHQEETGARASHAVRGEDGGVWLLDPLDAPDVDALIDRLGSVTGVVVLSNYHARDADVFANRYDVPVWVPAWMNRVVPRLDAPIERFDDTFGDAGFVVTACSGLPGAQEGIAYRSSDRTLYVPDLLSTMEMVTVDNERVGFFLPARLRPPSVLSDVSPEQIILGHGTGVFDDANEALTHALATDWRRFFQAFRKSWRDQLRAGLDAMR
ncbi:hypothetical protein [Halocatena halophila]|uniref:hypothetical protein n=1 Tax=Halocatena halophila TaxID=2814576 RepID=UPI002ED3E4F8